jgi:hypothetical protein
VACILQERRMVPSVRLLWLAMIALELLLPIPLYCQPGASVRSLGPLLRGEDPAFLPPGCEHVIPIRPLLRPGSYWGDYREALSYLRSHTSPATRVANFMNRFPLLAYNGPAGRLSPFPAAAGVLWLWQIEPTDEARFARALIETPDSLVVWIPNQKSNPVAHKLPLVEQTVREFFVLEQRCGYIEIWRRNPARAAPSVNAQATRDLEAADRFGDRRAKPAPTRSPSPGAKSGSTG